MINFDFISPTHFIFGEDMENECGKYIKKYGGSRVLIHYGSNSSIKSGLIDKVKNVCEKDGLTCFTLGGVKPNPKSGKVYEGIKLCKENNIDFVLAVGGGSVIDSSKAIAIGSLYDGDFWDFYEGKLPVEKAIPVGTILTIAAAGSEGSRSAVITKEEGQLKRSAGGNVIRPKFSILDPKLTMTLPPYQTACGITDMMAHVFERYFTNTKDVEVTDRLCEAVLLSIINEAPKVMANPKDYQARANIMWASTMAHTGLIGVGRSTDWNSHDIEHELSALYDCAHGAGLAVIMPAWMKYVYKHDVMRFAQVAVRVWGCSMDYQHPEITALKGINAFKNFLISMGMPTTFKELDAKEEDIPTLVKNFGIGNGKTGGFVALDKNDIENIYKLAL